MLTGVVLAALEVSRTGAWGPVLARLGLGAFGWGPLAGAVKGLLEARRAAVAPQGALAARPGSGGLARRLGPGGGGEPRQTAPEPVDRRALRDDRTPRPSPAGSDFHLGTLAAYGLGILGAELVLVLVQTALASASRGVGWGPPAAFGVALTLAAGVAFLGGFLGAARSRKLSAPEATIAVLYLGRAAAGAALGAAHPCPRSMRRSGRGSGRSSTSRTSWVVPSSGTGWSFSLLVLALTLGILTGFVANASGRLDVRTGFELFVARRHVHVFRPRLLLGGLVVLLLGIIPPLIILGILRAADAVVERTRIRELGRRDPLAAAKALHETQAKSQSPTEMMTALSVGGVGVGVMALIIVLSVMSGFEVDLQKKILGTNAHVVVLKYGDPQAGMPEYPEVMKKIAGVPGVVGQTPFLLGQVMVASEANVDGAIIKGIDPETTGSGDRPARRTSSPAATSAGSPTPRTSRCAPATSGPSRRTTTSSRRRRRRPPVRLCPASSSAGSWRRACGCWWETRSPWSPRWAAAWGRRGPSPSPRPSGWPASSTRECSSTTRSSSTSACKAAESFFGIPGATGVELKVKDVDDARRIASTVLNTLEGYPYRTKDWGEMNRNLFSALRLEKLVMGIILSIIVVVAAGLIVATVTMLVLEKRKEISVLKALGVPQGGIVKIFLAEGLQIGLGGRPARALLRARLVPLHREGGAPARPGGLLHPLAAGEDRAAPDGAHGAHRHPGHLPRVHLPGAARLARRAGGRAEGRVGARWPSSRSASLSKSYWLHGKRIDVLRGLSLDIERGELVSLVGASGSGKSTFLHVLGTLDAPVAGTMTVDGVDVLGLPDADLARFRNRTVGFVFQSHYLLPEFTALENVAMPALVQRMERPAAMRRARELLERVGLGARVDHRPGELSGGEAQRVALARALVLEPDAAPGRRAHRKPRPGDRRGHPSGPPRGEPRSGHHGRGGDPQRGAGPVDAAEVAARRGQGRAGVELFTIVPVLLPPLQCAPFQRPLLPDEVERFRTQDDRHLAAGRRPARARASRRLAWTGGGRGHARGGRRARCRSAGRRHSRGRRGHRCA